MGEPVGGAPRLARRAAPRPLRARRGLALALLLCLACTARTPSAGSRLAAAPDLAGAAVLAFPVQPGPLPGRDAPPLQDAERHALSAELAFWLAERGERTRWIGPADIERTLARSPGLAIDLHALDVARFRRGEVRRIGDPLFGDVYRLGTMADAAYALIPIAAARVPGPSEGTTRVEIAAALVDARDGEVLWLGVVAGDPGAPHDPRTLATAAQALALALIP